MKNILFEDKKNPISYFKSNYLTPIPHFHNHIEVIYVIEGEANAYVDRKKFHIAHGDILFAFSNQLHYYETLKMGEFLILVFSPELLFRTKELISENIPKNNAFKLGNKNCHNILLEFSQNHGNFDQMYKAGLINQLLALTLPRINLKPRIKTNNTTLMEIINFCSVNFADVITLDDISDALHISKFHISHLINDKLGISFSNFINNIRVYNACELIEDTDKKFTEISCEVGFGSIRSFNRAFKEIMNLTPHEYQNHLRMQTKKQ